MCTEHKPIVRVNFYNLSDGNLEKFKILYGMIHIKQIQKKQIRGLAYGKSLLIQRTHVEYVASICNIIES